MVSNQGQEAARTAARSNTMDAIGIMIMIVPVFISIRFNHVIPFKLWFINIPALGTEINIRPGLISTIIAVVYYLSLAIRYEGIFKHGNTLETTVSVVRFVLNCWVISALISVVVPTTISRNAGLLSTLLGNMESTLLVFALLLSWLGMRTVAGYSWILFVFAGLKQLLLVNSAMQMLGAVFILAFSLSLIFQIQSFTLMKDFLLEFRGNSKQYATLVKEEINEAVEDASKKGKEAGESIKRLF